jgi:dienelactone hydrolase
MKNKGVFRTGLPLLAAPLLGLAIWGANRDVCPACRTFDFHIDTDGGGRLHVRLYTPTLRAPEGLPAVVLCHGYLANLGWMEIPWAAELTQLGIAALFLDRRGHGQSDGSWWPSRTGPYVLDSLEPDLRAAIAYLRSRQPLIDPDRIALVGHSDGGTAVITAGTADWSIAATVAISASAAPWQYVNHVVPHNLLLLYGTEDRFILNDTDRLLISNSTRGYLDGPGVYGNLADGSARRLVRIEGRGHLGLLYDPRVHREVLEWLRQSLRVERSVVLFPGRVQWLAAGTIALVCSAVGLFWSPLVHWCTATRTSPVLLRERPRARFLDLAGCGQLTILWALGFLVGSRVVPKDFMPTRQGNIYAALLLGTALLLAVVPPVSSRASLACHTPPTGREVVHVAWDAMRGLATGILVCLGIHVLFFHHFYTFLIPNRRMLFFLFAAMSLPLFGLLEMWVRLRIHNGFAPYTLVLLSMTTLITTNRLFERMDVLPGYVLAVVLAGAALSRCAEKQVSAGTCVAFEAFLFSWLATNVSALY